MTQGDRAQVVEEALAAFLLDAYYACRMARRARWLLHWRELGRRRWEPADLAKPALVAR